MLYWQVTQKTVSRRASIAPVQIEGPLESAFTVYLVYVSRVFMISPIEVTADSTVEVIGSRTLVHVCVSCSVHSPDKPFRWSRAYRSTIIGCKTGVTVEALACVS